MSCVELQVQSCRVPESRDSGTSTCRSLLVDMAWDELAMCIFF